VTIPRPSSSVGYWISSALNASRSTHSSSSASTTPMRGYSSSSIISFLRWRSNCMLRRASPGTLLTSQTTRMLWTSWPTLEWVYLLCWTRNVSYLGARIRTSAPS
ncbi:hypothetical protein FOZ62_004761, partial [Perkinsus olseni]